MEWARLKQTILAKQEKRVLLRGRLKTKVTNTKTKEAPAATGREIKTNKRKKTACGDGAGNNKQN